MRGEGFLMIEGCIGGDGGWRWLGFIDDCVCLSVP